MNRFEFVGPFAIWFIGGVNGDENIITQDFLSCHSPV